MTTAESERAAAMRAENRAGRFQVDAVLKQAFEFIDLHSESWYSGGQQLLGRLESVFDMLDAEHTTIPLATSRWIHRRTKATYTVLLVTSQPSPEKRREFPRTVIYQDVNGDVWPRILSDFLRQFHPEMTA
jgi:hypothetical protein